MRVGSFGIIDSEGSIQFPNNIFESFSIEEGSILFGIFYPRSKEDQETTPVDYYDFMITNVPYESWPHTGRLIIRVKRQSNALSKIGFLLSENQINIIHSSTTRSGHRYSTIDLHLVFDFLALDGIEFNEATHYYEETNSALKEISDKIKEKLADILFLDENDKDLDDPVLHRINTGLHYFYWISKMRQSKSKQSKFIYEPFTLRYKRSSSDPTQGIIIANSGGKISNIIRRNQIDLKIDTLPTLVYVSLDSHYRSFRIVVLPSISKNRFIKLEVNYQRIGLP